MSLVAISGNISGTGTLTIAAPNTNSNYTLTLPTNTATLGISGPAFSAYQSSSQTLTGGVTTKIQCQTEEFDTANCYDNATNYRFTPNVAGYYQFNGSWTANSTPTNLSVSIYKNGVEAKRGQNVQANAALLTVSALIYMNGSTDYAELYAFSAATQAGALASYFTYFQASMVRAA